MKTQCGGRKMKNQCLTLESGLLCQFGKVFSSELVKVRVIISFTACRHKYILSQNII